MKISSVDLSKVLMISHSNLMAKIRILQKREGIKPEDGIYSSNNKLKRYKMYYLEREDAIKVVLSYKISHSADTEEDLIRHKTIKEWLNKNS